MSLRTSDPEIVRYIEDDFLRDRARDLDKRVVRLEYALRCITNHPIRSNQSISELCRDGFEAAAQIAEQALLKEERIDGREKI